MTAIPIDPHRDSSLAFLSNPYLFIPSRCNELRSDVFETRLHLRAGR